MSLGLRDRNAVLLSALARLVFDAGCLLQSIRYDMLIGELRVGG